MFRKLFKVYQYNYKKGIFGWVGGICTFLIAVNCKYIYVAYFMEAKIAFLDFIRSDETAHYCSTMKTWKSLKKMSVGWEETETWILKTACERLSRFFFLFCFFFSSSYCKKVVTKLVLAVKQRNQEKCAESKTRLCSFLVSGAGCVHYP